jgi:hypothetical protein
VTFSSARSELDSTIVEIELTLVSIIQGVALYFLIDNARTVLSIKQAVFWPYILAGLLVIFIFWSRSVLHILTLIRWPLEFGHNFLYIGCALVECLLFTKLSSPKAWFLFGAIYAALGWILFVYDLRLLHAREHDSPGEASNHLYRVVTRDQWLNINVLVPAVFFINLIFLICIRFWPGFFIARGGHVWLALIQVVASGVYLFNVIRFFNTLAPLIAEARHEWHRKAGNRTQNHEGRVGTKDF